MSVKMKDIADRLGVSTSTVSRALRNDPHISAETRKKVLNIARSSHFVKTKSTSKKIYYIIDKSYFLFTSNFYNPLIGIIEEEAQKEGYEFQFTTIDSVEQFLMKIDLNDVGGIIMTSSYIEALIPTLNLYNIPFVLVDSYLPLEDTSAVLTDNIGGILKAAKHLVDRGHSKIAYLEGELEDIDCLDRLAGYKRALEMFDLPSREDYVIPSDLNMSGSYQAMMRFLKSCDDLPTAVIGANDIVTIGAMQATKDYGLEVPFEISFVGFDDIEMANEVVPALTTVHVDKESLGKLSVKRLVQLIKNEPITFHKIVINPSIVERKSVFNKKVMENNEDKEVE
jgi:LacI family transcriptional regulator